jgi:hypothetical protein
MCLFFCGYKTSPPQHQPVYTKGVNTDTILRWAASRTEKMAVFQISPVQAGSFYRNNKRE